MIKYFVMSLCICSVVTAAGCFSHKVEMSPVEIKPIHITIDVNVKIDRALDNFFEEIDAAENQIESGSDSGN